MVKGNLLSFNASMQIKGLAIIFVVLGHLHIIENAGAWGVAMFLIVSGFGLTQSYNKNGLNKFFSKKIYKVLLPYSFVTIIWILIDNFIVNKHYGSINTLLLVIGLNLRSSVDSTMWYIPFLLLFYILFFITFKLIKSKLGRILVLLTYSVIFYMFIYKAFNPNVASEHYVLEFPIGVILGTYYSSINKVIHRIPRIIILILDIGVFYEFIKYMNKYSSLKLNVACMNLIVLACILSFILLDNFKIKSRILSFIGSISYELYLFEGIFLWKYTFVFTEFKTKNSQIMAYFMLILFSSICLKLFISLLNKLIHKKAKCKTL